MERDKEQVGRFLGNFRSRNRKTKDIKRVIKQNIKIAFIKICKLFVNIY